MALAPVLLDKKQSALKVQELADANESLAKQDAVTPEVREVIDDLVRELLAMSESEVAQMDPYLLFALQRGALRAEQALSTERGLQQRRELRIALEQVRQAFRDFSETWPVGEDRPAKDVARWLAETVSVPQATLATLVGTTSRTFQRWISPSDPTRPQGLEERRLRVIARITNQLRHALTGPGVVTWLQTPRDELGSAAPIALVDDPDATRRLLTLASRARSSNAA